MCLFINKNICNANTKKHILDLITFCKKIEPFVIYYKRLIKLYNSTAHNILKNEKRPNTPSSTKETKL